MGGRLRLYLYGGPHQDAISKGASALAKSDSEVWDVPYLPIDPQDVGRGYQALIRINQQSGKGGIAYLMHIEHGFDLPRRLQIEFAAVVQANATGGGEITPAQLLEWFTGEYLTATDDPTHATSAQNAQERLDGLLRPAGQQGTIVDTSFQPPSAESRQWVTYTEAQSGRTICWGVGTGASQEESLDRSIRSAARRLSKARQA